MSSAANDLENPSKEPPKSSLLFKRPSIVLRRTEGDEINVDDNNEKTVFDYSNQALSKSRKNVPSLVSAPSNDRVTSPTSPNTLLQITSKSRRRGTTSVVSTSGSDSEEGTTDITDISLSTAEEMVADKRSKLAGVSGPLSFLSAPPLTVTVPSVPGISTMSRWEETYTDKDRAAAVAVGTKDIKVSLLLKRKEEIRRMMPEEKGARVFYGQGVFQHKRHGPGPRATKRCPCNRRAICATWRDPVVIWSQETRGKPWKTQTSFFRPIPAVQKLWD